MALLARGAFGHRRWHRRVVLWGKDEMQYRKSVSIIEGGLTGKAESDTVVVVRGR